MISKITVVKTKEEKFKYLISNEAGKILRESREFTTEGEAKEAAENETFILIDTYLDKAAKTRLEIKEMERESENLKLETRAIISKLLAA